MKNLIPVLVALVLFASCEEGLLDVKVSTNLTQKMNIDIEDQTLKSTAHPFAHTDTLNLKDNSDINSYLDRIKALDIESASCSISGIPEGEEIPELTISFPQTGISITLLNLNENSKLDLDITASQFALIEGFLSSQEMLVINVDGTSSYAPMQLNVELTFKTSVTTAVVN